MSSSTNKYLINTSKDFHNIFNSTRISNTDFRAEQNNFNSNVGLGYPIIDYPSIANTNFSINGSDCNIIYQPLGVQSKLKWNANTNFKSSSTDLKDLFELNLDPFLYLKYY